MRQEENRIDQYENQKRLQTSPIRTTASSFQGTNGANGTNGDNGTNGVNGTEIDPCVACLLDALVKLDSGAVLVNVTVNVDLTPNNPRDLNLTTTLPLVIDVDVGLLLQQQLANATGLDPGATIFEICAAIDEQGLDIPVVLDGLEVTLVPIVEKQIAKLVLTIVAAINDLLGTSIVLTPEEVIDAVDIDDIVAQITANIQVSLEILETCLGQEPPPPPTTATLNVTKNTQCDVEQFGQEICNFNPQITVTDDNPTPSSFPASATPQVVTLGAGQYNVSEVGFVPGLAQCAGFEGGQQIIGNIYACADFSEDCSGDISAGESLSCEIDNTVIDTSPATLTVNKEIYGCNSFNSAPAFAIMTCDQGPVDPRFPWINCDLPSSLFDFPSICQRLPENLFDIRVLGPQNNLIYEDVAPENGTTFDNLQPGTYTVEEIKHDDNVNQLGIDTNVEGNCKGLGFTDGGILHNLNAEIDS